MKIEKTMKIGELLEVAPEKAEILLNAGMHCLGCPASQGETLEEDTVYPFEEYGNRDYVWKFPWSKDNWLQMYENIPGKTFKEHSANIYDNLKHVTFIAKNSVGLKNLFKIISFANTNFIQRNAKIPRKLIEEYREGLLIGSACLNG